MTMEMTFPLKFETWRYSMRYLVGPVGENMSYIIPIVVAQLLFSTSDRERKG